MCRNSICSSFEAFLRVLWAWTCSVVRSASSSSRQFSPPLPSLFPPFIQCDRCLFPFPVWGFIGGLPWFASHGRSLHLELAANSGSSWMFQATNLLLAMQLLISYFGCNQLAFLIHTRFVHCTIESRGFEFYRISITLKVAVWLALVVIKLFS